MQAVNCRQRKDLHPTPAAQRHWAGRPMPPCGCKPLQNRSEEVCVGRAAATHQACLLASNHPETSSSSSRSSSRSRPEAPRKSEFAGKGAQQNFRKRSQNSRGGQQSKCPNMCPFCTRKPVIYCPFIRLVPFLLLFETGIMSYTRMCLDSCGSFCCKLAGLKAHSDHQNPKKVALHGKTTYVGLHPQLVYCFTPILLQ